MVSFLTSDGKLPAFAQRRLDFLLDKKREDGLDKSEAAELREMLDYVDKKSLELLHHKKAAQRAEKSKRRGRTAAA